MKIFFVGESWNGSSARSLREALTVLPSVELDDLSEDQYFPKGRSLVVRAANRLLRPWHCAELAGEVLSKLAAYRPDVLMVYKGGNVSADLVRQAKQIGVFTVNVFPDLSPHAYGAGLQLAISEYDLVVSTKPFHPSGWGPIYGYTNHCVWVPPGYDPAVHYWPTPPAIQDFDLVLAATWRPQYQTLMQQLAQALVGQPLRVGIIGAGWRHHANELPSHWQLAPSLLGRAYGEWLRRGKIAIAPVHREVVIRGVRQPGDEDTTRTYELAAMGCFFLHRRTTYVQTIYDENTEVPMWDDAEELAALIRQYLPMEEERRAMAARAHARAVPAYSIPNRAHQILEQVREGLGKRVGASR